MECRRYIKETQLQKSIYNTKLNFNVMMKSRVEKFVKQLVSSPRLKMFLLVLVGGSAIAFAQNAAGDYTAGTTALGTVTDEIAKYVPYVTKLCYAIAGVVAVVGAISVYIKMNNEEQDVKKSIMMIVGACIFLVAAAQALPLFFGVTNS